MLCWRGWINSNSLKQTPSISFHEKNADLALCWYFQETGCCKVSLSCWQLHDGCLANEFRNQTLYKTPLSVTVHPLLLPDPFWYCFLLLPVQGGALTDKESEKFFVTFPNLQTQRERPLWALAPRASIRDTLTLSPLTIVPDLPVNVQNVSVLFICSVVICPAIIWSFTKY